MSFSVSIITPSLNQGRFIERTIQSVIHQNIRPFEYVVVDGGSSDDTVSILKSYQEFLSFTSESDNGQAAAINKGFKKTTGDIVGWLNSDDVYYPHTISTVLAFFEKNPDIDVVYGDANLIDKNDLLLSRYPTEEWNSKRLMKTCYLSQPAVFIRRRLFVEHGLLDETLHFCMDYEYWLRLAQKGVKFAYLPVCLAGSRLYPETKTLFDPSAVSNETVKMLYEKLTYVPVEWLINDAMLKIKIKTSLCYPGMLFNLFVFFKVAHSALSWNGICRGFFMGLMLPKTAIELIRYKKKVDALKES